MSSIAVKNLSSSLVALVALVVSMYILVAGGCGDGGDGVGPHPDVLLGTWQEADYNRGMVLRQNGDFQYVEFDSSPPDGVKGTGTWEATGGELTIILADGHFHWLQKTVTATTSVRFKYDTSNSTLTLTIDNDTVLYHRNSEGKVAPVLP